MRGYEKKRIFGRAIYMEKGMGSPYRIDNFIPILFLKVIPSLFVKSEVRE